MTHQTSKHNFPAMSPPIRALISVIATGLTYINIGNLLVSLITGLKITTNNIKLNNSYLNTHEKI